MTEFQLMVVSSAIHQYFAMTILSEGGFSSKEEPSTTYFCLSLDQPLEISGRDHYQNGSIQSNAHVACEITQLNRLYGV